MINRLFKSFKRDAGTDIYMDEDVLLKPGMNVVELNLNICPPRNYCAIICPRSSFALKGIFIANCPVDTDYQGNVKAIVFNSSKQSILVQKGERFCQFIVLKCKPNLYKIRPLQKGRRKSHGWGSSGKC